MNGIVINISWEYFLGIIGTLMGLAWYASGRFTRLETSVAWLTEVVQALKISSENTTAKLFNSGSPVALTHAGLRVLKTSGLKTYIDSHRDELTAGCRRGVSPYDVQACAFRLFQDLPFDESFAQHLNQFAFAHGVSTDLLRRVGAIYFRDVTSASA
jgi:hypothetical protein